MADLRSLPPELIELIFRFLGSIDDVHYLGRACQKTFSIIRRQALYVGIMRSVIAQAPQHRYDLQLCKMLVLHEKLVPRMQQDENPLPATWANQFPYTCNDWECALAVATTPNSCAKTSCTQCLPDEVIYDILARYQGLQVLEDLWLERQVDASDFFSADESPDANALTLARGYQVVINREEMYRDGELPARRSTTLEAAEHATLKADQRARFYSAVTFVWFLNEIRWVFTNATFPTRFDVQRRILEACKEHFSAQTRMPLLDELDQYAMFKFLYHHLLPVYGTFLADQCVGELPFTFSTDFDQDFGFTSRLLQLFVTAAQTYFQPPDLIDLVIRRKASRYPPYAVVTLPASTKLWQRPSQAFAFSHPPSRPRLFAFYDYGPMTLLDPRCNRLISRRTATHLNLIARSSFHQTIHTVSPTVRMPTNTNNAYTMRDHAAEYFLEQVVVAFDMRANPDPKLGDVRECFKRRWDDKLWEVWWWAGGEDKARAKMERWRKEEVRAGDLSSSSAPRLAARTHESQYCQLAPVCLEKLAADTRDAASASAPSPSLLAPPASAALDFCVPGARRTAAPPYLAALLHFGTCILTPVARLPSARVDPTASAGLFVPELESQSRTLFLGTLTIPRAPESPQLRLLSSAR